VDDAIMTVNAQMRLCGTDCTDIACLCNVAVVWWQHFYRTTLC